MTLHFKGVPDRLVIPFEAVTQFADPSVNFALQFPILEAAPEPESPAPSSGGEVEPLAAHRRRAEDEDDGPEGPDDDGPSGGSADIVSIDRFRKK